MVNGPGEAREADLGIAAGKGFGHLIVKGEVKGKVPEDRFVEVLVAEAGKMAADTTASDAKRRPLVGRGDHCDDPASGGNVPSVAGDRLL